VKQNFPPASFFSPARGVLAVALLIAYALHNAACVTLPRHTSAATQAGIEETIEKPIAETASRISINVAGAPELERLPGVGKVMAERIIAHRTQFGRFRRAEHLMMVPGISDQKFRRLRGLITTE
jgi:competence protein ComEA